MGILKGILVSTLGASLMIFSSCSQKIESSGRVIKTAPNAKVNLANIGLSVKNVKITRVKSGDYQLSFRYTLTNNAGAAISYPSVYPGKDDLIQATLTDQYGDLLFLKKRPMEDLTLTTPREMLISEGEFSRDYTVGIEPEFREQGEPITVLVRFHAPSRYDELRSTIKAPLIQTPWPKGPEIEASPAHNPLTSTDSEAKYPSR